MYNEQVIQLVTIPNVLVNNPMQPVFITSNLAEVDFQNVVVPPNVHFWAGDWENLTGKLPKKFDFILTSETIYSLESHTSLLSFLKSTLSPSGIILVSAKSNYFGCSGSVFSFLQAVNRDGVFDVEKVWSGGEGGKREILKMWFRN
ncbi:hypothetical protein HK098_002358 [Nowakowskiella sp. JEL0407]|nr:hypothetical protein HK098_002358 [Nowakowskiella sp. JEL0407]